VGLRAALALAASLRAATIREDSLRPAAVPTILAES
jgi:hypothetical protein